MTIEDIYPEIVGLGYIPDKEKVFWLYTVNVCDIDKVHLENSDSEEFAVNVINDDYYHFDDFYKCMKFLREKFGVEKNFRKDWETHYPQY